MSSDANRSSRLRRSEGRWPSPADFVVSSSTGTGCLSSPVCLPIVVHPQADKPFHLGPQRATASNRLLCDGTAPGLTKTLGRPATQARSRPTGCRQPSIAAGARSSNPVTSAGFSMPHTIVKTRIAWLMAVNGHRRLRMHGTRHSEMRAGRSTPNQCTRRARVGRAAMGSDSTGQAWRLRAFESCFNKLSSVVCGR